MKFEDLNEEEAQTFNEVYGEARQFLSVDKSVGLAFEEVEKQRLTRINSLTPARLEVGGSDFVVRDAEGNYYFDATLMSTAPNVDGLFFDESLLKKWADFINEKGILGDVDHDLYKQMVNAGYDDKRIVSFMKDKPGIAKAVKAFFEDGALRIRAWIDKRYKNILGKSKGLSLETMVTKTNPDNDFHILDGDLYGFTFNVDTTPASLDAKIDK